MEAHSKASLGFCCPWQYKLWSSSYLACSLRTSE